MGKEKQCMAEPGAMTFTGTGVSKDKEGKWFGSGNREQEGHPPGSKLLRNGEKWRGNKASSFLVKVCRESHVTK